MSGLVGPVPQQNRPAWIPLFSSEQVAPSCLLNLGPCPHALSTAIAASEFQETLRFHKPLAMPLSSGQPRGAACKACQVVAGPVLVNSTT